MLVGLIYMLSREFKSKQVLALLILSICVLCGHVNENLRQVDHVRVYVSLQK